MALRMSFADTGTVIRTVTGTVTGTVTRARVQGWTCGSIRGLRVKLKGEIARSWKNGMGIRAGSWTQRRGILSESYSIGSTKVIGMMSFFSFTCTRCPSMLFQNPRQPIIIIKLTTSSFSAATSSVHYTPAFSQHR